MSVKLPWTLLATGSFNYYLFSWFICFSFDKSIARKVPFGIKQPKFKNVRLTDFNTESCWVSFSTFKPPLHAAAEDDTKWHQCSDFKPNKLKGDWWHHPPSPPPNHHLVAFLTSSLRWTALPALCVPNTSYFRSLKVSDEVANQIRFSHAGY